MLEQNIFQKYVYFPPHILFPNEEHRSIGLVFREAHSSVESLYGGDSSSKRNVEFAQGMFAAFPKWMSSPFLPNKIRWRDINWVTGTHSKVIFVSSGMKSSQSCTESHHWSSWTKKTFLRNTQSQSRLLLLLISVFGECLSPDWSFHQWTHDIKQVSKALNKSLWRAIWRYKGINFQQKYSCVPLC